MELANKWLYFICLILHRMNIKPQFKVNTLAALDNKYELGNSSNFIECFQGSFVRPRLFEKAVNPPSEFV